MTPVLIDAAVYREGRRLPVWNLRDSLQECDDNGGFLWLGLKEPDEDELAAVATELGLHPLAVEDAVKGHQRPKLELYQGSTFLVIRTVRYIDASSDIETGEVMVFLGRNFLVTVRKGSFPILRELRHRLENDAAALDNGPTGVLHALLDHIVDHYLAVEAELEEDLEAIEEAVFKGHGDDHASAIYLLKREVMEFRRAVLPLIEPCRKLATGTVPFTEAGCTPWFRDVFDHLMRVADQLEGYERLLSDAMGVHLAQVSVQQNTDMRKISAWAAIAVFPTLIAGIYGMNFEHMPELSWTYGYAYALVLIAGVMSSLFYWFKKSGWL